MWPGGLGSRPNLPELRSPYRRQNGRSSCCKAPGWLWAVLHHIFRHHRGGDPDGHRAMTFRYVLDPLFMLCSALYVTNGWLLKPNLPTSELFFRNYFDDILLIPCFLPIVLLAHKCLSLRSDDAFPTAREAVIHLIIWSICFELIGPLFYSKAVGDPLDVAAYWLGGIASLWIWTTRGRVLRESGVRAVERVPLGRVTFKIIGS
jgi:hypothetical protein